MLDSLNRMIIYSLSLLADLCAGYGVCFLAAVDIELSVAEHLGGFHFLLGLLQRSSTFVLHQYATDFPSGANTGRALVCKGYLDGLSGESSKRCLVFLEVPRGAGRHVDGKVRPRSAVVGRYFHCEILCCTFVEGLADDEVRSYSIGQVDSR